MGLGKTVQCVSMLGVLSETVGHRGPFLVVVPLSVVPNWLREFKKWTPEVRAKARARGRRTAVLRVQRAAHSLGRRRSREAPAPRSARACRAGSVKPVEPVKPVKRSPPQASVVVYVGDSRSREVIRTFEFPMDQGGSGVAGVRRQRSGGKSREFRFEVRRRRGLGPLVLRSRSCLRSSSWPLVCPHAHTHALASGAAPIPGPT
jgi:hypothetical protein